MKPDTCGMARSWKSVGRLAALGVVSLASMGCESLSEPTHEVWGKINYKGEPIRGGVVILSPVEDRLGPWGIGIIKNDGEYYVISAEDRKPMNPGRYQVSFRRPASTDSESSTAGKGLSAQIPEKYLDPENPFISVELNRLPSEVDITLRD